MCLCLKCVLSFWQITIEALPAEPGHYDAPSVAAGLASRLPWGATCWCMQVGNTEYREQNKEFRICKFTNQTCWPDYQSCNNIFMAVLCLYQRRLCVIACHHDFSPGGDFSGGHCLALNIWPNRKIGLSPNWLNHGKGSDPPSQPGCSRFSGTPAVTTVNKDNRK